MFPQNRVKPADIEAAQPKAKPYKIAVGNALHLLINPNGSKYWRLKYRFAGKERNFSIGVYPEISFKEAIIARDKARALIREGIDPVQARQEAKKAQVKPKDISTAFQLSLSADGGVTILKNQKIISLSSEQTEALRSFLVIPQKGGGR